MTYMTFSGAFHALEEGKTVSRLHYDRINGKTRIFMKGIRIMMHAKGITQEWACIGSDLLGNDWYIVEE